MEPSFGNQSPGIIVPLDGTAALLIDMINDLRLGFQLQHSTKAEARFDQRLQDILQKARLTPVQAFVLDMLLIFGLPLIAEALVRWRSSLLQNG